MNKIIVSFFLTFFLATPFLLSCKETKREEQTPAVAPATAETPSSPTTELNNNPVAEPSAPGTESNSAPLVVEEKFPNEKNFLNGKVDMHAVGYRCSCAYTVEDGKEKYLYSEWLKNRDGKPYYGKSLSLIKTQCEQEATAVDEVKSFIFLRNCVSYDSQFKEPTSANRDAPLECDCGTVFATNFMGKYPKQAKVSAVTYQKASDQCKNLVKKGVISNYMEPFNCLNKKNSGVNSGDAPVEDLVREYSPSHL